MHKLWSVLALGLALIPPPASASSYTQEWSGATVSIIYPEKVTYNTAFDLSFSVDASTMTDFDLIAFVSGLSISNTVDLSDATWNYLFTSDDPDWNWNLSGVLGDSFASVETTASGYQVAFTDPLTAPHTWLWQYYSDKVTWTIQNMIIQDDTSFALTLDDDGILNGPSQHSVIVLDPPAVAVTLAAPAPIPEPATYALMLTGLAALVAIGRRRRPGALPAIQ
jgi:hypothetical protein